MKYWLSSLSFLLIAHASASDCFVVSGQQQDHNSFLLDRNLFKPQKSKVAGKECTVVSSWKEMAAAIEAQKIPKGQNILIVQGAHGIEGFDDNGEKLVKFACDAGDESAADVMKHLNGLSADYQVGAIIHSCYSGELMKEKLMNDEANPQNLDKLCLYTSSSMGRITYGHGKDIIYQLENAKPGDDLEKLFLKTRAGMISSAAWSEIGLPEYFINKTAEQGYKALQSLDAITRGQLSCEEDIGAANAALCAAPGITDEIFEDLSTFQDPVISKVEKELQSGFLKAKLNDAKEMLAKYPDNKLYQAQRDCYDYLNIIYFDSFGQNLEKIETWDIAEKVVPIIESDPLYESCRTFAKLLPEERKIEAEGIAAGTFLDRVQQYRYSLEKLQKRYRQQKFDDDFDIKKFARAAAGEKAVCNPNDKTQIIQSMFGESFFLNETENYVPDEMLWRRNVSTQLALKGFQNASIMKKEMPHKKDQKRREACRNFKF